MRSLRLRSSLCRRDGVQSSALVPRGDRAWGHVLVRVLFVVALACSAFGGEEEAYRLSKPKPRPVLTTLAGRWRILYQDAKLGTVTGMAVIPKDEASAQIVLWHPK